MNDVRHEDLLSELFADLERGEWNGHALLVPFDGMSNKERRNQMTTVTVDDPVVDDLGEFDVVRIQNVPLLPATQADAVAWATWLVWDRWQATPWPEEVSRRWTEVQRRPWRRWRKRHARSTPCGTHCSPEAERGGLLTHRAGRADACPRGDGSWWR